MSSAVAAFHGEFGRACLYELNRPMATHAHREGHLLLHVDGPEFASDIAGQRVEVGRVIGAAVSPFEPHDFQVQDPSSSSLVLVLYINPGWFLGEDSASSMAFCFGCHHIVVDEEVRRGIDRVAGLLSVGDMGGQLTVALRALTQSCYRQSWQQETVNASSIPARFTARDSRIRKSIGVMSARVGEDLQLHDIATEVGLSRPHFFRLFRENLGITPNVYLNTLRMEKAIQQLVTTDQAVTSIGLDLGFASQASFTRFFGANVGIPPTDYRRVVRCHQSSRSIAPANPMESNIG